jgi:DNA modification methylase
VKLNYIYHGDCVDIMRTFPEGVIDLTVTSPPYDNLRTYKGYTFKFEEIAKELYRVTKDGGVVVWVVGDATIKGSETGTSFRQALYFKEIGFNLHDTMIYEKINPIPQNHNRYEQCFEYMFVLSKGKPKTFNPLQEPTKNAGKTFNWGDRVVELDQNQARRHRSTDLRTVKETKTRRNIFSYAIGGGRTGHPAVFPEQLAQDHILSWSNPGDIVLDPMCGSGTTCKMAKLNGRNYIGIDIAEEYVELARRRVEGVSEE